MLFVTQEPASLSESDEPEPTLSLSRDQYGNRALASFERVLKNADEIVLEHYLIYHTRKLTFSSVMD